MIPDWVPEVVAAGIDARELATASADVLRERKSLESALGVHVAAYRADSSGKPYGLCIRYETAVLFR